MLRLLADWYSAIWPNLAASALTTLPALAWHHRRIKLHIVQVANSQQSAPKKGAAQ